MPSTDVHSAFRFLADRWLAGEKSASVPMGWTDVVSLEGPDPLTPLHAEWLQRHAPDRRRQMGTWYTPPELAAAVVGRIQAPPAPRVLDPAVGTGEFLLAAAARWPDAELEGWDVDETALIIARARLEKAGRTATLRLRDALATPRPALVDVVVGNPPWLRSVAGGADGGFVTGGHPAVAGGRPLFADVLAGVPGIQVKNTYNQYVYFWRLCLWLAFEQQAGPATVALLTPSSFLAGPGFEGLRRLLRAPGGLEVITLGGDGRAGEALGPLGVRTPACITVVCREPGARRAAAAKFPFDFNGLEWAPLAATGPLVEARPSPGWPVEGVFPWMRSGLKAGRTWPIAADPEALRRRWRALLAAPPEERRALFKDSPTGRRADALLALPADAPCPPIAPLAWRTFDPQWVLLDDRLLDRPAAPLWAAHGPHQRYLTTGVVAHGPAGSLSTEVPDLHCFSGRGARDVIPLWQADGAENLAPAVRDHLAAAHGRPPAPGAVFWYAAAVLGGPGYGERLGRAGRVVPLTADPALFAEGVALGRQLGETPPGRARCVTPIRHPASPRLVGDGVVVGDGRVADVAADVWAFRAGGLSVARHFITHRLDRGRRSSPLDDGGAWSAETTARLLENLWKIEHVLRLAPRLAAWLDRVLAGPRVDPEGPSGGPGQSLR